MVSKNVLIHSYDMKSSNTRYIIIINKTYNERNDQAQNVVVWRTLGISSGGVMLQENQTIKRVDMIHCALCADAPCNEACDKIETSDILRSIWFKNEQTAAQKMPEKNPCVSCAAPCEQLCVRSGKVEIRDIMNIYAIVSVAFLSAYEK